MKFRRVAPIRKRKRRIKTGLALERLGRIFKIKKYG